MWNWLWKLLGMKSKQLPRSACVPHTLWGTLPSIETSHVNTEEPSLLLEIPLLTPTSSAFEEPNNLYRALLLAKQEAFEPVLPFKEIVDSAINKVFPTLFKKSLLIKEDLILMSSVDVCSQLKVKLTDDEWHICKFYIIKSLNEHGIKATTASSGSFVRAECKQVLESIKDYNLFEGEDPELKPKNSVGIYR